MLELLLTAVVSADACASVSFLAGGTLFGSAFEFVCCSGASIGSSTVLLAVFCDALLLEPPTVELSAVIFEAAVVEGLVFGERLPLVLFVDFVAAPLLAVAMCALETVEWLESLGNFGGFKLFCSRWVPSKRVFSIGARSIGARL